MLRAWILLGLLWCWVAPVSAQSLDLSLSDESAALRFLAPLGFGSFGRGRWDIDLLYKDNDNKDDNVLAGLGMEVAGEAGADAPGLEFGIGLKGYYGEAEEYDIGAFALGGLIRYAPPPFSRFFGIIRLNYAPKIVTFRDADGFWGVDGRLGYEILPEAEIYIGYRKVEAGTDDGPDVDIDDNAHIGVTIIF